MTPSQQVLHELAPEGVLNAAINYGNPVLAQRGPDGRPGGVSVALAEALAAELGVRVRFETFDAAGKVFAALPEGRWALAFLAIEPVRAEQIAFSQPYVIIDGTYLVAEASPYQRVEDLDHPGARIGVGQGAAYDLYLSRSLQQAELVRVATSAAAVDAFFQGGLNAAAGVRQPLQQAAVGRPGYRVLEGSFTQIRQAMAVPKAHAAAACYIQAFLDRQIETGQVRQALDQSGQQDAQVGSVVERRS